MPFKDPDRYREYHRDYQAERRASDPLFKQTGNALSKAYQEKKRKDPEYLASKRDFQKCWYQHAEVPTPVVYFIEACGKIKIGYTARINRRISDMQTGCPELISLLLTIPGDEKLEAELRARFAAHRSRGEWFNKSQEILDYIQEYIDRRPPPE